MDVDLESRVDRNAPLSLRLWLRWQSCIHLLEEPIRDGFRTQFHTTPSRFSLMAQLACAPEGLKMKELSRRMMVTSGNVTTVTHQLVAAGWVRQVGDAQDRRSSKVCLTPMGRRQLQRMSRVHEDWVAALFAHLSARDRATMYVLLGKVKSGLQALPNADKRPVASPQPPSA